MCVCATTYNHSFCNDGWVPLISEWKKIEKGFWSLPFAMSSPGIYLYKCSQPLHVQGEDCGQLYMVRSRSHLRGNYHSSSSIVQRCWRCIVRVDFDWSNTLTLPNHWLHRMLSNTALCPRMPRSKSQHSLRNLLWNEKWWMVKGYIVSDSLTILDS